MEDARRSVDGAWMDVSIHDDNLEKCRILARFLEPMVGDYANSRLLEVSNKMPRQRVRLERKES